MDDKESFGFDLEEAKQLILAGKLSMQDFAGLIRSDVSRMEENIGMLKAIHCPWLPGIGPDLKDLSQASRSRLVYRHSHREPHRRCSIQVSFVPDEKHWRVIVLRNASTPRCACTCWYGIPPPTSEWFHYLLNCPMTSAILPQALGAFLINLEQKVRFASLPVVSTWLYRLASGL